MLPFGITKLLETANLLIGGEKKENDGPSTSNFTPATSSQALTYNQGGALLNTPLNGNVENLQNSNVYNHPNTNFCLYNSHVTTQNIQFDQSGYFTQRFNYPGIFNIFFNRRGNKPSTITKPQILMPMHRAITPKLPFYSPFQEIPEITNDKPNLGIYQAVVETRSLQILKPANETANSEEGTASPNVGNSEVHENGDIDIVLFHNELN